MKSFQTIILLSFIILLGSCQKKEIKIPITNIAGIQEVTNHSEVWIFMDLKGKDTLPLIKDHNLISSTNWIFNIDKHLKLKQIAEIIQNFQNKRLEKSIHNTEGFHNYFSFSDTISKHLSFVDFTNVQFKTDTIPSKVHLLKNIDYYKKFNNINLSFGTKTYYLNGSPTPKDDYFDTLIEFINFSKTDQKNLLHLNFNQDLTYQEYINIKTHLLQLQKKLFLIDENEYIFDASKVQECGCDS